MNFHRYYNWTFRFVDLLVWIVIYSISLCTIFNECGILLTAASRRIKTSSLNSMVFVCEYFTFQFWCGLYCIAAGFLSLNNFWFVLLFFPSFLFVFHRQTLLNRMNSIKFIRFSFGDINKQVNRIIYYEQYILYLIWCVFFFFFFSF